MKEPQSITSLPPAPGDERHGRMVKYSIAMGIRMLCIIACFFLHGWWLLVPAIGAVTLPYFAVIIANVGSSKAPVIERPGFVLPVKPDLRQ